MPGLAQGPFSRIIAVSWASQLYWMFALYGIQDGTEQAVSIYVRNRDNPADETNRNRIWEAEHMFDDSAPPFPASAEALGAALAAGEFTFEGIAPWDKTSSGRTKTVFYPLGDAVPLAIEFPAGKIDVWGEAFRAGGSGGGLNINYHLVGTAPHLPDNPKGPTTQEMKDAGAFNPLDPELWK